MSKEYLLIFSYVQPNYYVSYYFVDVVIKGWELCCISIKLIDIIKKLLSIFLFFSNIFGK